MINNDKTLPSSMKIIDSLLAPQISIDFSNWSGLSDFDSYEDILLIKYIDSDYIDSFIDGGFYFSLLKSFWGNSNDIIIDPKDPRFDDKESKLVITKSCSNISINGVTCPKAWGFVTYSYDILNAANIPISCFSHATRDSLSDLILKETKSGLNIYKFSYSFIQDLKDISGGRPFILCSYKDLVCKILNEPINSYNTKRVLECTDPIFISGSVNYVQYYNKPPKIPYYYKFPKFNCNINLEDFRSNSYVTLFTKEFSYKDQHEYRFAFLLKENPSEPFNLKSASLSDITNKYHSDFNLENFNLIYDKKTKKFTIDIVENTY